MPGKGSPMFHNSLRRYRPWRELRIVTCQVHLKRHSPKFLVTASFRRPVRRGEPSDQLMALSIAQCTIVLFGLFPKNTACSNPIPDMYCNYQISHNAIPSEMPPLFIHIPSFHFQKQYLGLRPLPNRPKLKSQVAKQSHI